MNGIHYSSPLCLRIFSYNYYISLITPLELNAEQDFLGDVFANTFATHILDAKYEQANVHNIAFDQTHLLLDQRHNLFNILSKHKNYLMALWESILIKKFTLTLNLEQSQCTTTLTLFLMCTNRPLKRNLITWLSLVSFNHAGPLNGHSCSSLS